MLSKILKFGYSRYVYIRWMRCDLMHVTSTATRYSQQCGINTVVSVATIGVVKLVNIFALVEQNKEGCNLPSILIDF